MVGCVVSSSSQAVGARCLFVRAGVGAAASQNITDPRLMKQIADESGARIGGKLYSDALTDAKGEAPTYIDMMRYNMKQMAAALATS